VLQRAALGVSLGWQPSRRDSLGIFVAGVTDDGPADKAGLVEGDRLVAINGQDLRVPREDAGDAAAAQARVSRLNRVLRGIKAGDDVELRVLGGGKVRTVKVKTVRAADLGEGRNWSFGPMIEGFVMPPTPPMPPRVPGVRFFDDDGGRVRVTVPRSRITI
jgi:predicted metalloprotease with PDZ domain